MGCLYQLTSPSGKSYLGITKKTADDRWRVHNMRVKEGRNNALQQAIRKYGADRFSIKTLVIADDWKYLCDLEIKAIAAFGTMAPNGYNLTIGGDGVIGPRNDAFKMAVSIAQKKRFSNPDEREKLRIISMMAAEKNRKPKKGKRIPGDIHRELWENPVYRERMTTAIRKAANTPEAKENYKKAAKKRAENPEWRRKMSESKSGKTISPMTEEAKKNHSEGAKRMWAKRKEIK